MNRPNLKGLCLTLMLLSLAAASATAQPDTLISAEMMSRAQGDVARMDENELRSLTGVLVDCGVVRAIADPQAQSICSSALEKYQIEYRRDRAVDAVLQLLQIAVITRSGKSVTVAFGPKLPGQIQQEDIVRALQQTPSADANSTQRIIEAEQALRKSITESFRKKRPQ
jgi:hypothetical protein